MSRHTRYQGLVVHDHKILLIKTSQHATGLSYWVIPGGGLDGDETEENCVIREIKEETNLDVKIEKLVFDEQAHPAGGYRWRKSYLCSPIGGEARPGCEPVVDIDYSIIEVRWFDLRDENGWESKLKDDQFTYPQLIRLREYLGYGDS